MDFYDMGWVFLLLGYGPSEASVSREEIVEHVEARPADVSAKAPREIPLLPRPAPPQSITF